MRKTKDQEFDFVVTHYQEGRFDPEKAMKSVRQPSRRYGWVAAAASVACVVAFAAVITWQTAPGVAPSTPDSAPSTIGLPASAPTPSCFHFDDTPVSDVLRQLSAYYNVSLQASDTTLHLTGDFSGDQLDDIVGMIEEVLDIDITRR